VSMGDAPRCLRCRIPAFYTGCMYKARELHYTYMYLTKMNLPVFMCVVIWIGIWIKCTMFLFDWLHLLLLFTSGVMCVLSCAVFYGGTSPLSADTLCEDITSLQTTLGTSYDDLLKKEYCCEDVSRYYEETTGRDYWLLERFIGPGLHSLMNAPQPVGRSGGNTRQAALILGEVCSGNAHRVMEVGCGRGYCSLFLAGVAPEVMFDGIDLVKKHVDIARHDALCGNYTNVSFSVGNMLALDMRKKGEYDVIFGCEALCHLDTDETLESFVHSAAVLLKKGGRLIIIDGFRSDHFDECAKDYQIAMKLAESGFRIRTMPSKRLWKEHCRKWGLCVTKEVDLTHEVMPFWTLGWRVARVVLLFPYLVSSLLQRKGRETLANLASVSMTAHAFKGGTAEYGLLVFEKFH
jgi:SAM-dependent methyltransferase